MNDTALILCSRPKSRRLPNKCFRKAGGRTLINHIWQRVKNIRGVHPILAVPYEIDGINDNGALHKYREEWPGQMEFGHLSPLHRMADILLKYPEVQWVVRVTHDDPIVDANTIEGLLSVCQNTPDCGYGVTPGIIDGAGVEVIHRLNIIHAAAHHKEDTEYISYFVRGSGLPKPKIVKIKPRHEIERSYRLTIDYQEDLHLLEAVLRGVGKDASTDEICKYIDDNTELLGINLMPEVSVYTCAYNAAEFMSHTLESVWGSLNIDEYLFVDDCSTDETLEILLTEHTGLEDKLIINEDNMGLASSCNRALDEARGRYILRLDADDILRPDAIQKMLSIIKRTGAAVVYPAYQHINENGNTDLMTKYPKVNHHAGCALFDKNALQELRFTEGLRNWEGKDLYNRLSAKFPIAYTHEPLWLYRKHSNSMSSKKSKQREEDLKRISE